MALQNEIDILTQVDHPNIVKLTEVFEDEKFYALVMELMTGGEVHTTLLFNPLYFSCSIPSSRRNSTVKRKPQTPSDPSSTQSSTATPTISSTETSRY